MKDNVVVSLNGALNQTVMNMGFVDSGVDTPLHPGVRRHLDESRLSAIVGFMRAQSRTVSEGRKR